MSTTPSAAAHPADAYRPVALRPRHDGWTAARQRLFLTTLAETGCVTAAAEAVGLTPRSAYRLRAHPKGAAFARAWDKAQIAGGHRLLGIAFDRAINGSSRTVWKNGELVCETRVPSDRLLMFLLGKVMPHQFGPLTAAQAARAERPAWAQSDLPAAMDALVDVVPEDCPPELLGASDYEVQPPLAVLP